MSKYVHSFSAADQATLDRPDFRPLHHPSYTEEFDDDVDVNPVCRISETTTDGTIHAPSENIPRIRRRDLRDFREIWLRGNPKQTNKSPALRGYWVVNNWGDDNTDAVMIVQYKTFRIWLRRGSAEEIILSTADVDEILSLCLGTTNGNEMPCRVGHLVCRKRLVQWLISPVARGDIENAIHLFRSAAASGLVGGWRVNQNAIIAEMYRRHKHGNSDKYTEIFRRLGINTQRINEARNQTINPPFTLGDFLDKSLEALFWIFLDDENEPGPLPLWADDRRESGSNLSPEMWNLCTYRELHIATNAPEQSHQDEEDLVESLARYYDIKETYDQEWIHQQTTQIPPSQPF